MGESTAKTAETPKGRTADAPGPTGSTRHGATGVADRPADRRTLLERLRAPRRPRLWFEILLIGVSYWLYSLVRNAVPEQRSVALRHADWVWSAEHHLGLAVEHGVNHAVNSATWLIVGMNYYYATLHFVITIGVLVWLYVRHPERYGPARLVLFLTTWLALVGFWAFPLAPPRMLPGDGFVDTMAQFGPSAYGAGTESVTNQYAAMPSLHAAWAMFIGFSLVVVLNTKWRWLALLHPLATILVVVATGNHYWLDVLAAACLVLLALLVHGFAPATGGPVSVPRQRTVTA